MLSNNSRCTNCKFCWRFKSFYKIHVTILTFFFLCLWPLFKSLGILGGKMSRSCLEELAHITVASSNRIWSLNFILDILLNDLCQLMIVLFLKRGLTENGLTCVIYISTDGKKILVVQQSTKIPNQLHHCCCCYLMHLHCCEPHISP